MLLQLVARAVGRAVIDEDEFAREIAALRGESGDDLAQEAPLVEHRNDEADAVRFGAPVLMQRDAAQSRFITTLPDISSTLVSLISTAEPFFSGSGRRSASGISSHTFSRSAPSLSTVASP